MALPEHKNPLMNTLRKKVDVVEERDELSKSVASLNLSEGEKMRHADKIRKVEKEFVALAYSACS